MNINGSNSAYIVGGKRPRVNEDEIEYEEENGEGYIMVEDSHISNSDDNFAILPLASTDKNEGK